MGNSGAHIVSELRHPGNYLRKMILQDLGLSVTEAAQLLGVHRVGLSRLLNGRASLSAEMAIRLEKAFGADLEALMRMQNGYDIAQARLLEGRITVERYLPPSHQPIPAGLSR
ncbi:HigA family addiction module antitoxin [Microvirga sp. Mcv34]|uniref:HigA family addiction module antitoxin n=1 Tax=Microvirga sp. Mcv34 TaxID=2926016 RepID=UPI0021C88D51|nr:HigA family addiction module antitoxin [Microvirga sp. Mcv34]